LSVKSAQLCSIAVAAIKASTSASVRNVAAFQARQKRLGLAFRTGSHARIKFGDVQRRGVARVMRNHQPFEGLAALLAAAECVDQQGRIQQDDHLREPLRPREFGLWRTRFSFSNRIFHTPPYRLACRLHQKCAATPPPGNGINLFCQVCGQ
jgi:hypothetical protein